MAKFVRAQASDTLFYIQLHYASKNIGPQAYFYAGDKLVFEYDHKIGSANINMATQLVSDEYKAKEFRLISKQKDSWTHTYSITSDGAYQLKFEPEGDIHYLHSNMIVSRIPGTGNANKPTSCMAFPDRDSLVIGTERHLSFATIDGLQKSDLHFTVNKEVSSNGLEYCEVKFDLRRNQSAVVSFSADEIDPRTNLIVYKLNQAGSFTPLFSDYQYSLDKFGFQSLSGGTYVVRFWGRTIFKRADDVKIQVTK